MSRWWLRGNVKRCAVVVLAGLGAAVAMPATAEDDGLSLMTRMIGRDEAGESGPRTAEEATRQARRAVFQIQTYGPDGSTVEVRGGGFLVTADGVGVTRASTLPSSDAMALLREGGIPLMVRTLKVDRDVDLALVKLAMPTGATAFPSLELADEDVPPGSSIWAVCFDGPRACRLDEAGGRELVPDALSQAKGQRWLAITGSLGAGGCEPIINIEGRLVGVTTPWVDPATGSALALAAEHVRMLMERPGDPMRRPVREPVPEEVSVAPDAGPGWWDQSDDERPAESLEPIPTLEVARSLPAAALRQGVRQLRGYHRSDRPLDGETLWRIGERVLPTLAKIADDDQGEAVVLSQLTVAIDDLATRGAQPLAAALTPVCDRRLERADLPVGQPTLAAGQVVHNLFYKLDDDAGILLRCEDRLILITDPRIEPDVAPDAGSTVFAGGLFTGYTERDHQPIAVLQHGFARIVEGDGP